MAIPPRRRFMYTLWPPAIVLVVLWALIGLVIWWLLR